MEKRYLDFDYPLHREIPKRPLLFPFLTHLLHSATGFRPENAFALNFLVLFALLATVFCIFRKLSSPELGIAAQLLVASQPLVAIFAATAGFDLLSAYLFLACLLVLYRYLDVPSARLFGLLWCQLLLFSHVRYESFLLMPICLTGLLFFRKVPFSFVKQNRWILALTPVFVSPLLWQRILRPSSYQNPRGVPLFGVGHFFTNLKNLILHQFHFEGYLPYATVPNLVALVVLAGIVLHGKKYLRFAPFPFFPIAAVSFVFFNVLYLAHFFGKFDHPSSARFFLILVIFLSMVPMVLPFWNKAFRPRRMLVAGIFCFCCYHPVATRDPFTNSLDLVRKTRFVNDFIKTRSDRGRLLFISDRPGQLTALGYGAVKFRYANRRVDDLADEYQRRLYTGICAIQDINASSGAPVRGQTLHPRFQTAPLAEWLTESTRFVRISRVDLKSIAPSNETVADPASKLDTP
jgi:hypothetical protein